MDPALVTAAVRCAEDRLSRHGAAGQLVVLRRGQVVVDRVFGAERGGLFLIYSCSKPYVALLTHLLVERGQLSLDEPIAGRWPRFTRHGKRAMTARHVLTHRAGVPDDHAFWGLLTAPSWRASVWRMEELRPLWPPGEVTAYHALTYGWILGELVRRVSGAPIDELLRTALLEPLGLRDTFLGLPDAEWRRAVPMRPAGGRAELGNALVFNRRRYRQAVAPAATVSSTARDVALLFEMLRRGGTLDGVRALGPEAIAEARRPAAGGPVLDRALGRPTRWAHGFHLGGAHSPVDLARFMGSLSAPETFGCIGSDTCTAWADPGRELAFAYVTNLLLPSPAGIAHHSLVADCILRACG
ncbi:MAG TPA: serine hydrolase domain-containing protein [Candidatus Dormibacteraeota bacterium]|nr:serine hydrolase domain-containing protein [Candidatus Dormibacteraeota bacterium]